MGFHFKDKTSHSQYCLKHRPARSLCPYASKPLLGRRYDGSNNVDMYQMPYPNNRVLSEAIKGDLDHSVRTIV